MRVVTFLSLLALAAPALRAQADPNPPASYYPLHVGDVWEYGSDFITFPSPYNVYSERREVLRDSVVGGMVYAVVLSQRYRFPGGQWVRDDSQSLVRFDVAAATVVALDGDGSDVDLFGCRFDLPFPSGDCQGSGPFAVYSGSPEVTVQIGSTSLVTSVRSFDGVTPGPTLAAGIGDLGRGCEGTCPPLDLRYARVAGVEYGVRPVADESAAPAAEALWLAATPNPTAGTLALSLTLAEERTVTVEAFDALGRRVWMREAPFAAGAQSVSIDTAQWAPGVYVVRATAGSVSATARVVRR